jgi:hypothetical protein
MQSAIALCATSTTTTYMRQDIARWGAGPSLALALEQLLRAIDAEAVLHGASNRQGNAGDWLGNGLRLRTEVLARKAQDVHRLSRQCHQQTTFPPNHQPASQPTNQQSNQAINQTTTNPPSPSQGFETERPASSYTAGSQTQLCT